MAPNKTTSVVQGMARPRSSSQKLKKDPDASLRALEEKFEHVMSTDAKLQRIEDKLDKVIFMMQSYAVEVAMNLDLDQARRFQSALKAAGCESTASSKQDSIKTVVARRDVVETTAAPQKPTEVQESTQPSCVDDNGNQKLVKMGPADPSKPARVSQWLSDNTKVKAGPADLCTAANVQQRPAASTNASTAQDRFPSWASHDISQVDGEWTEIGPHHLVREGTIAKVVSSFRADDETRSHLFVGEKLHIVNVDSDGDILVYSPAWATSGCLNDCPRWVARGNFSHIRVLSPKR